MHATWNLKWMDFRAAARQPGDSGSRIAREGVLLTMESRYGVENVLTPEKPRSCGHSRREQNPPTGPHAASDETRLCRLHGTRNLQLEI